MTIATAAIVSTDWIAIVIELPTSSRTWRRSTVAIEVRLAVSWASRNESSTDWSRANRRPRRSASSATLTRWARSILDAWRIALATPSATIAAASVASRSPSRRFDGRDRLPDEQGNGDRGGDAEHRRDRRTRTGDPVGSHQAREPDQPAPQSGFAGRRSVRL